MDTSNGTPIIRVFILDDHAVVRAGLRDVLTAAPGLVVVGDAGSARAATAQMLTLRPDVALVDVRLPDGSGIDVARHVRSAEPSIRCIMFTAHEGEDAFLKSAIAGAVGYLSKGAEPEEVVLAVRRAAAGESLIDVATFEALRRRAQGAASFTGLFEALSAHERRILDRVAEGWTNQEIADHLGLAEKTVRNYVSAILGKVGVRNRTQLAVYVAEVMTRAAG